jgi:cellulose biosynthesis protein BcsQ
MSRLSVAVLSLQSEDSPFIHEVSAAAERSDISFIAHCGELDEIYRIVEDLTVLPEILLIQVPEGADPEEILQGYGERLPEGEAETILFDVPNDISVYRSLKQAGVREIFSGIPTGEDIEDVFEEIRQNSLRRSGIDPRKAVYVFSACGGAGGTSLATTFARKFAREGRRTLYIDLDLATGPGSFMFNAERGARETMGLMEALANPNRIDALFLERAIDVADKNLFYLSARRRSSDPDPDPASIPVLVSRAQQNFDMVVVDVPWRPNPEPDMMAVQGHCYVVAPPSPAGLLGFSVLIKEIDSAPARNPVYGVINRQGEFKSNDILRSSFKEAGDIEMFHIPYDAVSAGRMFFEQKTYIDMSGKLRKSTERILKTLPGEAGALPSAKDKKAKSGKNNRSGGQKKSLFGR